MDASYFINYSPLRVKMDLSFLSAPLPFIVRYDDKLMVRWSLIKIMLTSVSSKGFAIRTISLARFITPATPSRARRQGKSIHCIHQTELHLSELHRDLNRWCPNEGMIWSSGTMKTFSKLNPFCSKF